ncbi:MAG TPA: hypothetical protein VIQ24_06350 [Pyrinomonadaceae bacterium]
MTKRKSDYTEMLEPPACLAAFPARRRATGGKVKTVSIKIYYGDRTLTGQPALP